MAAVGVYYFVSLIPPFLRAVEVKGEFFFAEVTVFGVRTLAVITSWVCSK